MSKLKIIYVLGIWVAILPFLGFPLSLKNILFSITGLLLIYVNYLVYTDFRGGDLKEKTFENFSENSNFDDNEKI